MPAKNERQADKATRTGFIQKHDSQDGSADCADSDPNSIRCSDRRASSNHLIGAIEKILRHCEAQFARNAQIDKEPDGALLYR